MELLIITGAPYSGKGTQCEFLKEYLGYKHISMGDVCRSEKEKGTELGKIMSEYHEKGNLVPNQYIEEIFEKLIEDNIDEKGIILDGHPRTLSQVDQIVKMIEKVHVQNVINIDVEESTLLERAKERAKNSDRPDDKDPTLHTKRIEVFKESTLPAVEYMSKILPFVNIDGNGTVEETREKVKENLFIFEN